MSFVPLAQHPALYPLLGPPALVRPESLTDQAARLADHLLATAPALPPRYVARKVLEAVAFSLEHGLRDLALPTKLVGVAAHQPAVEALALPAALPLADRPRLVVSEDLAAFAVAPDGTLQPVGRLQPRHALWLAPLVARGAAVHLHAVTGVGRRARGLPVTLGVNVRVSALSHALQRPVCPEPAKRVAEAPAVYRLALHRYAA